jgi:hypothetical protein
MGVEESSFEKPKTIVDIDTKIYRLLSKKEYYSLSIKYVSRELNVPLSYLQSLNHKIGMRFENRFGDRINIFIFNDVEYIGLESRRIDYEIDKMNGCNWVEDAIAAGLYDK